MNAPGKLKAVGETVEQVLDKMDAARTDNLRIWEVLSRTDPAHTKGFSRAGGFKGTAIKPMWIIRRLTEQFGPCGQGWGIGEPRFEMVHAQNGDSLVYCTVSCWHGSPENTLFGVGGDKVAGTNKNGQFTDDEAFKKAFTDAVNNAFKFIGVAADIHMGLFEDSKYLAEVKAEFAETPKTGEPKPNGRVKLDGPYTCPTQLMTAAREFVRTLNGMSDLEEFTAWKQTDDVKQFVNQLRRDMPDWWSGGASVPADFVPLELLVAQKKRDLEQIDGLKEPA